MVRYAFSLALLFLIYPLPAFSLNLTLSPSHYAEAMEFYYKKPRPEIVIPLLRSYEQARILYEGEKRLLVAAFLSELIRDGSLNPAEMVNEAKKLGKSGRLTVAWSLHLSQMKNSGAMLEQLLGPEDKAFANQLNNTPGRLLDWDPAWERSVLGMYWGAFMATGREVWIDRIIEAAMDASTSSSSNLAAASLYEYAPRHPVVVDRLKRRLENADQPEKARIKAILGNV